MNFLIKKYKKNRKVKIFNKAISNKSVIKTLNLNHHDLTTTLSKFNSNNLYLKLKSILFGVNEMTYKKVKIRTLKLDQFLNRKNIKIDLLKIDTEGHELEVLKGVEKTLKKSNIY